MVVMTVIVRVTARDPEPPSRSYLEHTPGLLVDTTSHDLDLVRYVTGAEIVEVSTRAASLVAEEAQRLARLAALACALSLEAVSGNPGPFDEAAGAAKAIPGFEELEAMWSTRAPLGWDETDQEPTARAVCALLSDFFPATTGEIVHVDGGLHAVGA